MQTLFHIKDTIPPESREEMCDFFHTIFGNDNPLVVEIGSGNGHFLIEYAKKSSIHNFIGTELLFGRAKKFHSKIEKQSLKNIVVFKGDARRFVWEFLYRESVEEFIILFPDPWPKKRHHKHRLLNAAFINMLQTRLTPQGLTSIATDYREYRDWILNEFEKVKGFTNIYDKSYSTYPDHYPKTLFEERFRNEGREIYFVQMKKSER